MRVDYTLPALQPAIPAETQEISSEGGSTFRQLVQGENVPLPTTVDDLLRLDVRPYTGTYIGPPPRPQLSTMQDAETQRQQWYGILRRHSDAGLGSRTSTGRGRAVQNMMDMLRDMQGMEDAIVSQSVALSRG